MKNYQCSHCGKAFQAQSEQSDKTAACPHCGQLLVIPSTELSAGTVLGGFRIIGKIGEGGMGNVYVAEQTSMGRRVALKVLAKEFSSDQDIIQQFRKEVQLSGKLNHPYIVRAIDAGEEGDFYYMAVTFIDGEDYEKILSREKSIPEAKALAVAIKTAETLAYAWEKHNLLHRDVKPGNIMENRKGEVFLMDLGIAQSFDLRKKDSPEEHVLGSPFYMSPEQAQAAHLDWRTDLYSLGATLYHMASGFPPFDADKVETIVEMHVHSPLPDPNSRTPSPGLSPATVALLNRMLAKKPDERFASWREFISEAQKALDALSRPKPKKFAPRRRMTVAGGGRTAFSIAHLIALLAILCAFGFIGYKFHQMNKDSKALKSLRRAENFLAKFRNDYEGALPLFEEAAAVSAGTPQQETALKRFNEVKSLAEGREERIKYFDRKFNEAEIKMKEKAYEQALEILESIKDIDDDPRRRNAEDIIAQLRKILKK